MQHLQGRFQALHSAHTSLDERYSDLQILSLEAKTTLSNLDNQKTFLQQQLQKALSDAMRKEDALNDMVNQLQRESKERARRCEELVSQA